MRSYTWSRTTGVIKVNFDSFEKVKLNFVEVSDRLKYLRIDAPLIVEAFKISDDPDVYILSV